MRTLGMLGAMVSLAAVSCAPLSSTSSAGTPAPPGATIGPTDPDRNIGPVRPPLRTTALGSDESDLPTLYPHGDWLTIDAPLLAMDLWVSVVVNGRTATATLDTGAQTTTMSEPMARRLGVLADEAPRGSPVHALDAHGDLIRGERLTLAELVVGERSWRDVGVTVIGQSPDLFLIGADLLQQLDLFIAADEGLVGLFDAGTAPHHPDDVVITLRRGDRQLTVVGSAVGRVPARFPLLVDTGAWNTSVPATIGINAGLDADLAYAATTVGVAGEQESRGRFVLSPLRLGGSEQPVGRVLAIASTIGRGDGLGLLGNDVFFRFHSVVSFRDATLRFRQPPARGSARHRGPGGAPCGPDGTAPCIQVQLLPTSQPAAPDDIDGTCLQIDVDAAYAGNTVEMAIVAYDDHGGPLFNGGAIRAFLSVARDGAHHCFTLWRPLERLGLRRDSRLSLRWVRTEGVRWPCDPLKTRCITFTGPLAR
jgi:clan AA aspartic protease (TIGR02281 family)